MYMTWYNPLSWFSISRDTPNEYTPLYCCNPQCRQPIDDGHIAYDKEHGTIYHIGECQLLGVAWETFNSKAVTTGDFSLISRLQAFRLLENKKLKQPKTLEEKVEL